MGELEEVIDDVNPETAGYRDPALTAALAALPASGFALEDLDDGVPQAND